MKKTDKPIDDNGLNLGFSTIWKHFLPTVSWERASCLINTPVRKALLHAGIRKYLRLWFSDSAVRNTRPGVFLFHLNFVAWVLNGSCSSRRHAGIFFIPHNVIHKGVGLPSFSINKVKHLCCKNNTHPESCEVYVIQASCGGVFRHCWRNLKPLSKLAG